MSDHGDQRQCSTCGIFKTLVSDFRRTGRPYAKGYTGVCKPCIKIRESNWKDRHTEPTERRCSVCRETLAIDQFGVAKNGRHEYRCRPCNAKRGRDHAAKTAPQFRNAKAAAVKAGREWTLSLETYTSMRALPCHYCGVKTLPTVGSGLDRLDSSKGYLDENVVPCCTVCNVVKGAVFTESEMKILGVAVAKVRDLRAASGDDFTTGFGRGRKRKYPERKL